MAIGRISGSVLKSNLTRNGVDLAFETNLLYLDVTNSRVGIGTSEPSTALTVNGTITTSSITTAGGTVTGNVTVNDSVEVRLGSDADANIKHTGSDLNINETTGDINIRTYADNKDVVISSDDGSGGLVLQQGRPRAGRRGRRGFPVRHCARCYAWSADGFDGPDAEG